MSSNAVDSLLTRLRLGEYIEEFRARGLANPKMLKNLAPDELDEIFAGNQAAIEAFNGALKGQSGGGGGGAPPKQRGMYQEYDRGYDDRGGYGGYGNRGRSGYDGDAGYGGYGGDRSYGGGDRPRSRTRQDNWDSGRDEEVHHQLGEDVVEVTVSVPHYTVPFLLGERAKKLNAINQAYGTTNSRINRQQGAEQGSEVQFSLYGKQDKVELAKAELETLVGITKVNKVNHKFQEMLLGRTKTVTALLYALNERRNGVQHPCALEPDTIPEHVSQFLFCNPYSHITQFYIKVPENARRKFDLIGKILFNLKTVQALVFCSNSDHLENLLKARVKKEQLCGIEPKFMNPRMSKADRDAARADFEKGYGPLDKWEVDKKDSKTDEEKAPTTDYTIVSEVKGGFETDKNRLLISSDDYARFSRRNDTPYVGLVVNYDLPKTKEGYLHRIAITGRMVGSTPTKGVAITLMSSQDESRIEELQRFGLRIQELPANFAEAVEVNLTGDLCKAPESK